MAQLTDYTADIAPYMTTARPATRKENATTIWVSKENAAKLQKLAAKLAETTGHRHSSSHAFAALMMWMEDA